MQHIHYIAAAVLSLLLAIILGAGPTGYLLYLISGAAGAYLAERLKGGSERVYWGFALGTILLITISNYGANFHRLIIILPLILALGYFGARLALRFTGRKPA